MQTPIQTIGREELEQWMERNEPFVLVEVLGPEAYDQYHLPGAINVPLGDDFDERICRAVPDKRQTVVVYCQNRACSASPQAARRMQQLGYERVLDYEAGKEDWRRAGLAVVF